METNIRRRLEMGRKALTFSRATPDSDAGYTAAVAGLEQELARADALATEQRDATVAEQVATEERRRLRDHIRQLLLRHVATVAVAAAREAPDLAKHIRVPVGNDSYEAFRIAAGSVAAAAQARVDLLVRHGLSPLLLTDLVESLAKFDEATQRRNESRLAHIGARDGLVEALDQVVKTVHVIGGFNRHRYQNDRQQLAAWAGASNIFGPVERAGDEIAETLEQSNGTPDTGSQVKPAA